jgi:hypothetical protein
LQGLLLDLHTLLLGTSSGLSLSTLCGNVTFAHRAKAHLVTAFAPAKTQLPISRAAHRQGFD